VVTVPGQESADLIDVALERARTRGVAFTRHFNAAGSALPSVGVVRAVVDHLRREEEEGGYEAAAAVRPQVEEIYDLAARVLGCHRDEIALVDSASTGLRVVVDALDVGPGHRFLVSRSTYVSHALHLMSLAARVGAELSVLPTAQDGSVDLAVLRDLLAQAGDRRDVVCVAHVPTSSGLVEPVAEIGELARRHGALYVLDATQSVGQLPVDVVAIGCDALATTGRKFLRAPRGTGVLYVRRRLIEQLEPAAPDVRGAEWTGDHEWELVPTARRFETFECSTAARLGLGVALRELLDRGVPATAAHLATMTERLRSGLAAIEGVTVQDPKAAASAIVTFTVDGAEPDRVKERLARHRIKVVTVPAGHGQWDLGFRKLGAVVRASLHVYNDEHEVAAMLDVVEAIAREARQPAGRTR